MNQKPELPGWCLILQKLTDEIEDKSTAAKLKEPSEKNVNPR